jgi:hypothetical protein
MKQIKQLKPPTHRDIYIYIYIYIYIWHGVLIVVGTAREEEEGRKVVGRRS